MHILHQSSYLSSHFNFFLIHRYHKFLLWLGIPPHRIAESRPNEFCRILSEFALEYRTTRERVHQQIEKKANHRERNKTRGKLIIDVPKFKNGNVVPVTKEENSKDEELRYFFCYFISFNNLILSEKQQQTTSWYNRWFRNSRD